MSGMDLGRAMECTLDSQDVTLLTRSDQPVAIGGLNPLLGLINYCFCRGASLRQRVRVLPWSRAFIPCPSRSIRLVLLAGVAAIALSRLRDEPDDHLGPGFLRPDACEQSQATLGDLSARYKANPKDKGTMLYFAAALRAAGQTRAGRLGARERHGGLSQGFEHSRRLCQGAVVGRALRAGDERASTSRSIRQTPDWNALLVKGVILDQSGRNADARAIYTQALLIAPGEASLEANIGLSYAMTNDLTQAESASAAGRRRCAARPARSGRTWRW